MTTKDEIEFQVPTSEGLVTVTTPLLSNKSAMHVGRQIAAIFTAMFMADTTDSDHISKRFSNGRSSIYRCDHEAETVAEPPSEISESA
jgi:hypothetical protein